eukprot:c18936_g1_i2 orf=258-866(-)
MSEDLSPGKVLDETCWTSIDFCKQRKHRLWPYHVSKTLAEQKAFEYAKENGIDVVSILPSVVVGPFLTPHIPISVEFALALVTGDERFFPYPGRISYTHVDDLAMAHIFVYEHPAAEGRYICSNRDASVTEVADMLAEHYPEFKVFREFPDHGDYNSYYYSSEHLKSLGFKFEHTLEDMFHDAIFCCKERGMAFKLSQDPHS